MKKFLVLLENSNKIDLEKDELIQECRNYYSTEYSIYQSFYFAEGTGFMKTVRDEIDLVIQSQKSINKCQWEFDKFVTIWKLEEYLDFNISDLSGGWRKYLGVALFINLKTDGKIFFDASRYLSDKLINLLFKNIESTNSSIIFIFDYDITPLKKYGFRTLFEKDNKLNDIANTHIGLGTLGENNYEYN